MLLNLHEIAHPHTGYMLAAKLIETLTEWDISKSKVLAVITDNGSNMAKAIRVANDMTEILEKDSTLSLRRQKRLVQKNERRRRN